MVSNSTSGTLGHGSHICYWCQHAVWAKKFYRRAAECGTPLNAANPWLPTPSSNSGEWQTPVIFTTRALLDPMLQAMMDPGTSLLVIPLHESQVTATLHYSYVIWLSVSEQNFRKWMCYKQRKPEYIIKMANNWASFKRLSINGVSILNTFNRSFTSHNGV